MPQVRSSRRVLLGATALAGALSMLSTTASQAQSSAVEFDQPAQPLASALRAYSATADQEIMFADALVSGRRAPELKGAYTAETALMALLDGTGLTVRRTTSGVLLVERVDADPQSGSAAGDGAEGIVDTLVVTAQKREEDIQDVPIAISAFSQEDLTTRQVAGGPDLMTQVPNFTFTKTNFSSYSIQIRGIGTQAISATVDPAVAVAFNNTPFIRNRFFEQEFYDLQRVEVLRGPQGTLYGRNATAGVVNILSQRPEFVPAQKLSADVGDYNSLRLEGMVNIPLVEDKVALRIAGAWTKRDGYTTNELTGNPIDGRDLWSTRVSLRFEPTEAISANLIWEHFQEDDDRLRSGKQLCKRHTITEIGGVPVGEQGGFAGDPQTTFSQGCLPASMYSDEAFQVPNGYMLPYYLPLGQIGLPVPDAFNSIDPYINSTQSKDLRVIEAAIDPTYRARTDIAQLQLDIELTPSLTLSSETAYSADMVFSSQDFNRFSTRPGAFAQESNVGHEGVLVDGVFCDPQLGCSDRLVLGDLSTSKARQFSQELRLSSDFDGPLNFSLGANFLRADSEDKYYVFANSLTLWAANASWTGGDGIYDVVGRPYVNGVTDNMDCIASRREGVHSDPQVLIGCIPIDPNPIDSLNDTGHNYFLSKNPYRLISYAAFGEMYYNVTPDVKLTAGLRLTVDKKNAPRIPSWLIVANVVGYPVMEIVEQEWQEPTGRVTLDWKPDLGFTDETLFYYSYAHGYKAGGMNPPPAVIAEYANFDGLQESLIQPKTFEAEFVDALEIGTKNTLLDGRVTFNANAFFYDYKNYQLSQIINRSAVTGNYDAKIWGVEIEADWRPLENLRFGFKGGYENTSVAKGERAIDIMDRTAGDPNYAVVRPFPTVPSNCILPVWFITYGGEVNAPWGSGGNQGPCVLAFMQHVDPVTKLPYVANPTVDEGGLLSNPIYAGYPGFDPSTVPNNGEGIYKKLGGNELPNAPHFTTTLTVDYTIPLSQDWLLTLHSDYYRQSKAWTRIFNMDPYDRLKPYENVNLAAILTNEEAGWNIMAYVKNVFDNDAITGAFLNSDDTGLTTNVFLLEPRLYGLRVTKNWTGSPLFGTGAPATGPYPLTVEVGGSIQRFDAPNDIYRPNFLERFDRLGFPLGVQDEDLDWGDGREVKLTYRHNGGPWWLSAGARFGRTNGRADLTFKDDLPGGCIAQFVCDKYPDSPNYIVDHPGNYASSYFIEQEEHTLVDFAVGRDFGLGALADAKSSVSLGVRYAELESRSKGELWGMPNLYFPETDIVKYYANFDRNDARFSSEREFQGAGPSISWDAAKRLWGDKENGQATLEWTLSGAVLFGKQKTAVAFDERSLYFDSKYVSPPYTPYLIVPSAGRRAESKSATVPNLGASLGLAYEVGRIKASGGYRFDRFFDAIDGGLEERSKHDRTIDGPYFKLSVGFGG